MASIEGVLDGSMPVSQFRFRFGDGVPFGADVVQMLSELETPKAVKRGEARAAIYIRAATRLLGDSTDPQQQAIAKQINTDFFNQSKFEPLDPLAAVIGTDVIGWLGRAGDAQIVEFCKWNVAQYQRFQAELDTVTEELQDDVIQRTKRLVDMGFFPNVAKRQLNRVRAKIGSLTFIDSFESGGMQAAGYFMMDGTNQLALANLFSPKTDGITKRLVEVNFHEHLHGAGAVNNSGFFNGLLPIPKKHSRIARLIEEPFVAHATSVATVKPSLAEPEIMAPSERHGNDHSYHTERELLVELTTNGKQPVRAQDLAEAFFERRHDARGARRHIISRLMHNVKDVFPEWGEDGLWHMVDAYEKEPQHRRTQLVQGWLETILRRRGVEVLFLDEEMRDEPCIKLIPIAAGQEQLLQ